MRPSLSAAGVSVREHTGAQDPAGQDDPWNETARAGSDARGGARTSSPVGTRPREDEPRTHLHGTPTSHEAGVLTAQRPLPASAKSAVPQRPGNPRKGPVGHPHSGEDRSRARGDASLLLTRRLWRTAVTPQAAQWPARTVLRANSAWPEYKDAQPDRTVSGTPPALPRREDSTSRCL